MAQLNTAKVKPVKTLLTIREKDRKLRYEKYVEGLHIPEEFKKLARKKNK